ncbi:acyl-CoA thioesterase [Amycolatopsis sp. NPDC021455]|uniref:acyl-CoA thioesterase n=1 Tax=Amycolatopsis sp. NPDC021455 TaxID=3154901 RepID=UPI0033C3AFE2
MTGPPFYEYRHVVGFEETNLVGNVYYVNYLRWQGRCRELFLRDEVPELIADIRAGLRLLTVRCECDYLAETTAFDEISVRMRLDDLTQTRIGFAFDYVKGCGELVARGYQRVACLRGPDDDIRPCRVPEPLRAALSRYAVPPNRSNPNSILPLG